MRTNNSKSKLLFFVILGLSFLFSLSYLFGNIDPDFFSSLYVGREILEGGQMYVDVVNNKGPVHQLFFVLIYAIFGNNYSGAQVVLSTAFDAFSILLIIKIISVYFDINFELKKWRDFAVIILFVGLYKSFSVGSLYSGFNSEMLPFFFILLSIYLHTKKKLALSSLFYTLAIFARQTVAFFILIIVFEVIYKKIGLKYFIKYLAYVALWSGVVLVFVSIFGDISYFIDNFVLFNVFYAQTVNQNKLSCLVSTLYSESKILISLAFSFIFSFWFLLNRKMQSHKKLILLSFFFSSFASTFVGGRFFYHHFVQYSLFVLTCFLLMCKKGSKILMTVLLVIIFSSLVQSYGSYTRSKFRERPFYFQASEVISQMNKKYLKVVTYYPQLYLMANKEAPDKYYIPFHLSEYFNGRSSADRDVHAKIEKKILRNTLFVFIINSANDKRLAEEYKYYFEDVFALKKIESIESVQGGGKVEMYESTF